jgi:hypothetical protein
MGSLGRAVRCSVRRSSSQRTAARTASTLSAPSSFQNFSLPFTRELISSMSDSTHELPST